MAAGSAAVIHSAVAFASIPGVRRLNLPNRVIFTAELGPGRDPDRRQKQHLRLPFEHGVSTGAGVGCPLRPYFLPAAAAGKCLARTVPGGARSHCASRWRRLRRTLGADPPPRDAGGSVRQSPARPAVRGRQVAEARSERESPAGMSDKRAPKSLRASGLDRSPDERPTPEPREPNKAVLRRHPDGGLRLPVAAAVAGAIEPPARFQHVPESQFGADNRVEVRWQTEPLLARAAARLVRRSPVRNGVSSRNIGARKAARRVELKAGVAKASRPDESAAGISNRKPAQDAGGASCPGSCSSDRRKPFVIFFAVGRATEIAIQQMPNQPNFFTAIVALQAGASLVRLCVIITTKFLENVPEFLLQLVVFT